MTFAEEKKGQPYTTDAVRAIVFADSLSLRSGYRIPPLGGTLPHSASVNRIDSISSIELAKEFMSHSRLSCFVCILGVSMAATLLPPQSLHAEPNHSLEVKFTGLRDAKGQVCLSLFSGPRGFPGDSNSPDLLLKRCGPISSKGTSLVFDNLKPGNYAITAFHDANGDSRLNKGGFGIPLEGFGFSRNPEIGFSAPSFAETQFKVSKTPTVIEIKFRYMN